MNHCKYKIASNNAVLEYDSAKKLDIFIEIPKIVAKEERYRIYLLNLLSLLNASLRQVLKELMNKKSERFHYISIALLIVFEVTSARIIRIVSR